MPLLHLSHLPSGSAQEPAIIQGAPYALRCPGHCGTIHPFADKPLRHGRGWPQVKCGACRGAKRLGSATCCNCSLSLSRCTCSCVASDGVATAEARG
eukprot:10415883-Alexandrium_andersonii.AAC.1